MALTGVDPNDPTPSTRREFVFAAGESAGTGSSRDVIMFANRTSAGTETLDTRGEPISDGADCKARYGVRSEAYNMWRRYVAVDPLATIRIVAVTESAGTAAECDLVVATVPTADATLEISITGIKGYVNVSSGDAIADIATAIKNEINDMDNGGLMVTADVVTATVTVTCIHKGPRGDYIINSVRTRWLQSPGATTVTKGNVVSGATPDDGTNGIISASQAADYYWISCWTESTGSNVIATDNQLGEMIAAIKANAMPAVGKEAVAVFGLGDDYASAYDVADETSVNSVRAFAFHAENNDWPPCWIAAHCAAVMRSQQIQHPSANINGYANTDNTPFEIPSPFNVNDRPTAVEIRSMLNGGVSPIGFTSQGYPYIVRQITTRSHNGTGIADYRAREGHITSAIDFSWDIVKQRWNEQKQPFVAEDPKDGQLPTARTTTPNMVKGLINSVIDDLTSSKPLGIYDGPILAPDKREFMKNSVTASKTTGGIYATAEFVAVEHLNKFEGKFFEVGGAY